MVVALTLVMQLRNFPIKRVATDINGEHRTAFQDVSFTQLMPWPDMCVVPGGAGEMKSVYKCGLAAGGPECRAAHRSHKPI